jgi:hypothetical protein
MYIILWESAFLSPELEPFSMEKFIASLRSCLFSKKFFISWETCLGLAFNLFFFLNYFLSTKRLFKYFTNFFINSICWKKILNHTNHWVEMRILTIASHVFFKKLLSEKKYSKH